MADKKADVEQKATALKVHHLRPAPGAKTAKTRVGRGEGSKGKTAGRGHKGQRARKGGRGKKGFEGGQMPIQRRLPKRGFTKPNAKSFAVINLGQLQGFIDAGKLDAKAELDEDSLVAAGLVRRKLDGVRLLAKGELTAAVKLTVTGASAAAQDAVAKAGGTLVLTAPKTEAAPE